jgi:hypothetical protein
MSRLPLTDRPHALLVDATISAGNITIFAPLAVLVLAAKESEGETDATTPAARPVVVETTAEELPGPGLARCAADNVVALPVRRRVG